MSHAQNTSDDTTPAIETWPCPVERVTAPPAHHFFGYYDKCPWSVDGRWLAALAAPFMDHDPAANEPATVGVVDLQQDNTFHTLSRTVAWNWQQGCMMRWLPGRPSTMIFNDREGDRYVTASIDLDTGERQMLFDRPTYDISDDGRLVASLNFARVGDCRPGYGYAGVADPNADETQPDDDGLYLLDTQTGRSELVVTIRRAAEIGDHKPGADCKAWFNHLKFSPNRRRLMFLHRWSHAPQSGHKGFETRVMILDVETGEITCVNERRRASHYDWLDDDYMLFFLYHEDGPGYYLIDTRNGQTTSIGAGTFAMDGHCVYRPQRDWFATDTYPKNEQREQPLMLYKPGTGRCVQVGAFHAVPSATGSRRCDLHARWDRAGRQLCFDSTHEGTRQMYVMDVGDVIDSEAQGTP